MKNLKSVIINVALILISVLALVFMSQAFMSAFGESVVGYDFLEIPEGMTIPTEYSLTAASVIINIIVLSVMILVSIVNLLVAFGVIKNEKIANILNIINIVAAVLFLCSAIMGLAALASYISGSGIKLGWALIVNLVLAVAAVAATVVEKVVKK